MIRPVPEPIPGAPPYVVWLVGLIFIMLALLIVASVIVIGVWMYHEAKDRDKPAWLWLIFGLLGGWLTALVWIVVRDHLPDPAVARVLAASAAPAPDETEDA